MISLVNIDIFNLEGEFKAEIQRSIYNKITNEHCAYSFDMMVGLLNIGCWHFWPYSKVLISQECSARILLCSLFDLPRRLKYSFCLEKQRRLCFLTKKSASFQHSSQVAFISVLNFWALNHGHFSLFDFSFGNQVPDFMMETNKYVESIEQDFPETPSLIRSANEVAGFDSIQDQAIGLQQHSLLAQVSC